MSADTQWYFVNMSRPNSGELKRESSGNTVTIRPGGLSFRLSEPIESHKFTTASESLDDLRRKLDVEHTSISSKLEQGAAARQELQDLKGKIMEDLELSKASLAKRLDKVENKLAAARKIHTLKQDMSTYLVGQLSEAEGSLDGCSKTCSRQAEYVSKLTFEIEETDKKLVLEAERLQRLSAECDQLNASIMQNTQDHSDNQARLNSQAKAEAEVQGALLSYTQSLQEELENLKRKFIVETRFKSKQQANEAKLSSDLEAVDSKLQQERALHRELEVAKKQATEELDETSSRLENELKNLAVSLQSEQRLAEKMDQFSGQMLLRLEHIKGSFIAVGDVRNSLEAYVQNLENRKQAVTVLEEKCEREIAEAEKVKSQLQREELEVEEVFESEINEISGNMDTCAILAQHNKRYLSRLEQQLKQNQERIEIDTLNRADYEELKQRLEEEATMARNRVDTQERDMHALSANRRQLQDERDKKIGSMRADIQALADRIAVEAQSLREHQSKRSEIEGEVQILNAKLESNKSVMLELKLTRERISQLLTDLKNQRRSGEQLVDALKAQEVQLQEELSGAKDRLKKELDDINFRLDVQDKAISGLTGFQKKVWADLEYIRTKLLSTEHVLLELEETIKRIGMMLDAAVQRHDLQQQGIEKIRSDIERSETLRKTAATKEKDSLERLQSQIQAEQKLKSGVMEYQQRLIEDKFLAEKRSHVELAKVKAAQEYLQRVEKEVQEYRVGCDAAASAVNELEQQKSKIKAELAEVLPQLDVKFLGEIEDVQERLEVDLRASVGLEGYRRNIGDEIELIRQKLGVRRSAFNT